MLTDKLPERRMRIFQPRQIYRFISAISLTFCLAQPLLAADKAFKASDLPAPPSAADQAAADKLVKDVYKSELAKTTQADKTALAAKLLDEGRQTTSDPAAKFVLLRTARDLAADSGDVATAMAAVDAAGESFNLEIVEMKITALNRAGKPVSASIGSDIIAAAMTVVDQIIATDQFNELGKLVAIADLPAVRASPNQAAALRARITEARTVATQFDKAKAALEKLKNDPANPEANLTAGRYMCFLKGDWTNGLPLLAKGSDAPLKTQAAADLAIPADVDGFKKLADTWWTISETQDPASRRQVQLHASDWYEKASEGLSGLAKTIAEKRVADAHKTAGLAGRVVNLIALVDTKLDSVAGDWRVDKGTLRCDSGGGCPRVRFPYAPPEEYDVHIEWTQTRLRNPIFIVLSKGDSNFALGIATMKGQSTDIDGVPGGNGFPGFPGRPPVDRATAFKLTADLAINVKHSAVAEVRRDGVKGIVDGKQLVAFKTNFKDLALTGFRDMRDKTVLGIGCDDPTVFTLIEVTEVTGNGKAIPRQKP